MKNKQKIIPHLWFDTQAKEAAAFYTSLFENSKIKSSTVLENTPSGNADMVSFTLAGQDFMAISAGPYFKFTPAISFMVACKSVEEVNDLWAKMIVGGEALMDINEYPFSKRYGWLKDKYGLTWQLIFTEEEKKQKITPSLLFTGKVAGKVEEAINFYTSIFKDSAINSISRYGKNEMGENENWVNYGSFKIENYEMVAMDSGLDHKFTFNEAVSLIVNCETQEEIDYYWENLSAVPEAEQCGWIKDKYGVSWQITPTRMEEMFRQGDKEKIKRVTEAFLKMKKFDLKKLEEAYEGKK